MYYIIVDNGIGKFEFYRYNKPREAYNYEEELLISIKTSGTTDCKPFHMFYFYLEGEVNRITDTNVPELKPYVKEGVENKL